MGLTVRLQQWEGCSSSDLGCVRHGARMDLPVPQAAAHLLHINVGRCCSCPHHHFSPSALRAMRPARCVGLDPYAGSSAQHVHPCKCDLKLWHAPNCTCDLRPCSWAVCRHWWQTRGAAGGRPGLLQALRDAQMRGAALPFLQGLVADTACEQVERREGYRVSRQVVHPKLTFKESPGLGEPRVTSIPQGKPVQAGPGSSSCSRGPSAPHAASAAAAAGSQGSHPGTASSGQGSRPPSDSKAASTAAAAGRRGSNSGMPRASPAAEAGTHLLGKVAGTQGSSRSAEASSSLTSQGSPACPPRQSSWAKGSSWATEGSSTKASPETQKGPAPAQPDAAGNSGNTAASCKGLTGTEVNADAGISRSPSKAKARSSPQPAAADDSGDRIASYRGLIGTEAEPEVHLLHSGQHDLATSWGDANRNLYVDVSRPKVGLCSDAHDPIVPHCTLS